MPLFLILLLSFTANSGQEVEDVKTSLKSLIAPLVPNSKASAKGFRVDKCEKKKINWFNVMTMKEEVTMNYKFAPGCDIEGSIRPKIFSSFPAELKLRNIKSFDLVKSENRITASFENPPILNLDITKGELTGKKSRVKFEADYKLEINPLDPSKIQKNLGGELRISEINGKKVSIKEKILIK